MDKKQIEQGDRKLLKEYSRTVQEAFMPSRTRATIGEIGVSSHWLTARTHWAYTPINLPHLKGIFEEKVSEEELLDLQNRLNSIQEIMTKRFDDLTNKIDKLSEKIESLGKERKRS